MVFLAAMTKTVSSQCNEQGQGLIRNLLDSPLFCGPSYSCLTNNGAFSCQKITSYSYRNISSGTSGPPSTTSGFIVVPSSSSQRIDGATSVSKSPSTSTSAQLTANPPGSQSSTAPTTEPAPSPSRGGGTILGGGVSGGDSGCSPSTNISSSDPTNTATGNNSVPQTSITDNLPIIIPSAVIVVFAIISAAIGNRREWILRAFRHLTRERTLRRSLTDASHGRTSLEDAIPLRDLQTPPPAYSPYLASWADREFMSASNPMGRTHWTTTSVMGTPHWNTLEMMEQAYPRDDRGRHYST